MSISCAPGLREPYKRADRAHSPSTSPFMLVRLTPFVPQRETLTGTQRIHIFTMPPDGTPSPPRSPAFKYPKFTAQLSEGLSPGKAIAEAWLRESAEARERWRHVETQKNINWAKFHNANPASDGRAKRRGAKM